MSSMFAVFQLAMIIAGARVSFSTAVCCTACRPSVSSAYSVVQIPFLPKIQERRGNHGIRGIHGKRETAAFPFHVFCAFRGLNLQVLRATYRNQEAGKRRRTGQAGYPAKRRHWPGNPLTLRQTKWTENVLPPPGRAVQQTIPLPRTLPTAVGAVRPPSPTVTTGALAELGAGPSSRRRRKQRGTVTSGN